MRDDLPFRIALIALYTGYTLIRLIYHRAMRRDASPDVVREPRPYVWGLRLLIVYEVSTLMVYLFAPQVWSWAALALPPAVRWIGVAGGASALALLVWTHHTLGTNFRPTLRVTEAQRLVTDGPYRLVRHPMYTALALLHLGAVLLMANAFLGATWLVGLTLLLVARIPREEAMMRDQFGTAYRALEARTGRLLPRWPTAPAAQPAMRSLNTRAEGTGAGETRSRDGS